MEEYTNKIENAAALLRGAERVVAFTGAGISTESGLSDFRSPGGVWDRHRVVTYQEFMSDGRARMEYWRMKRALFQEMQAARPNRAHYALAELERMGKLQCLITQNIDGLHQDAGSLFVVELHGTNRKAICVRCGKSWTTEEVQAVLEHAGFDPRCDGCGGYIKPATVSFGQAMPEREMTLAFQSASLCDLFLMVGSSLQVEPAASIPRVAHSAAAKMIFVNRTETPWDHIATVLFRESSGQVLGDILKNLKAEGPGHACTAGTTLPVGD